MRESSKEAFYQHKSWKEFEDHVTEFGFEGCIPYIFSRVGDDDLLTPVDISELTGYSTETVRRWCRSWKLKTTTGRPPYNVTGLDLKEFLFHWTRKDLLSY